MYATAEGTARYSERFPVYTKAGFYRTVLDLHISTLGIGTYLGPIDDAADRAYTDALITAGQSGINLFDCAINYRRQHSERCVGEALKSLQRDEIVICTKAGYLTPGAVPEFLEPGDIVGGMHSLAARFLLDQIERSRANMAVDTIDVFYLHNPETQLSFCNRSDVEVRIRRAFAYLEEAADRQKIRWYGVATWDGLRRADGLSLPRLAQIAEEEGGRQHRFRFVQLPFNLGMVEAYANRPENVLDKAAKLGITAIASATLLQTRVLSNIPEGLRATFHTLKTDAQLAIQFTRSTPGITSALVGMGRRAHVLENLGVASVPPATPEQYLRLYR